MRHCRRIRISCRLAWRRREIENYLCQESTLLAWAQAQGCMQHGDLFAALWREAMEKSIADLIPPIARRDPKHEWWMNMKASDQYLDPLFDELLHRLATSESDAQERLPHTGAVH